MAANVEKNQQDIAIVRKRDRRHYGYESTFGNQAGIFYDLKNVPFILGDDATQYSLLKKRDRRHYGYQSIFGNQAGILYDLKNVPFIFTRSQTEYWTKHRRKWLEHTYPSFFMNITRVPTHEWVCETSRKSDEWTCN